MVPTIAALPARCFAAPAICHPLLVPADAPRATMVALANPTDPAGNWNVPRVVAVASVVCALKTIRWTALVAMSCLLLPKDPLPFPDLVRGALQADRQVSVSLAFEFMHEIRAALRAMGIGRAECGHGP